MTKEPTKSKQKPTYCKTCPPGKHNVRTHQEHIPPSKKHPEGSVTVRHEHCAKNPTSHKIVLSQNDIHKITAEKFANINLQPIAKAFGELLKFHDADNYDALIQGWTGYWNDVLKPKDPLDPNLVKALMATESGFNKDAINDRDKIIKKHAHGLLQVTKETAEILKNARGELKNHLVDTNSNELYDPSTNICCGIRWLFRKKAIETAKFGREATWREAIIGYKGYWDDINSKKHPRALQELDDYYQSLSQK